MQDHAKKRVHIWSFKSNTKLSPRHPKWSRHCEGPSKLGPLKKRERFWVCLLGNLSFWVSGVESPLIFFTKKNKKKIKYNYTWLNCSISLIE